MNKTYSVIETLEYKGENLWEVVKSLKNMTIQIFSGRAKGNVLYPNPPTKTLKTSVSQKCNRRIFCE